MHKLAIIVPYYKIDFFEQTLNSIENQTDKRFNLYIGDDASPDNPEELIQKSLFTTPYMYFFYDNNMGGSNLAGQWKRIISESQDEEWLMILGDDDVIESNFVESFYKNVEYADENNIAIIKFSNIIINEHNEKITEKTILPKLFSSILFLEKRLKGLQPTSLSENIFRRSAYNKHSFKEFPLAWHSDDYAILQFSEGKNILCTNESTVKIRLCNKSISGQDNSDPRKRYAYFQLVENLLKNYTHLFSQNFTELLIKRYRESIWRDRYPMKIDITKIYFKKKLWVKAVQSLKMKYDLQKRVIKKNKN